MVFFFRPQCLKNRLRHPTFSESISDVFFPISKSDDDLQSVIIADENTSAISGAEFKGYYTR